MRNFFTAATLGVGLGLALFASAAEAHGPSRQKTSQEVLIDATPDEVWAKIGHFNDLGWHPAVFSTEAPDGDKIGGSRTLTLGAADGPKLIEELTKYDAAKRSYSYRISKDEIEILPVTNYSSTLKVEDRDGKALVTWSGAFYRGHPNNNPPPELSDEAAIKAVNDLYRAGLDALAAEFKGAGG